MRIELHAQTILDIIEVGQMAKFEDSIINGELVLELVPHSGSADSC